MLHSTRGIVLKTTKYGETSMVVTILTEALGIQTYIINGVRSTKKTSSKANLFQPTAILDLVVYHHEQRNMHRIKEFSWGYLYESIFSDIIKNNVALYMIELLYKCLKQPEKNTDLFTFCKESLQILDHANSAITANFPLYFSLQLPHFFGFKILTNVDNIKGGLYIDLQEGAFFSQQPIHPHFITGALADITARLLKTTHPQELENFKLNHTVRRQLLMYYQTYYSLHIQEFGQMKTLRILQDVL